MLEAKLGSLSIIVEKSLLLTRVCETDRDY